MKQDYIKELLAQAKAAGIEAAEAYLSEKENFSAMRNNGALEDYQSNHTRGLGFRGLVNGRMGYASTEALDEESIGQLIRGVIESATLCESDDEQPLYQGGGQVLELELYQPELDKVAPEAKLAKIEAMENACKAADSRYLNGYNMVETTKHTVRIANSFGMDQTYTENFCDLYCGANVKEGDNVSTGGFVQISRDFDALDPDRLARDSVDQAVKGLNAEPGGLRQISRGLLERSAGQPAGRIQHRFLRRDGADGAVPSVRQAGRDHRRALRHAGGRSPAAGLPGQPSL